ncbi:MAG: formimidoylglutamase [Steroidobacteraceae bacterium]
MTQRHGAGAWTGRVDAIDGAAGRRWHQVVQPAARGAAPGVALVGFACDAGVRRNLGRPGAAAGPMELRRALANLAWHGGDARPLYDADDVRCDGDALEQAQRDYASEVATLLGDGHLVVGLGGGHEIAWGTYQGIARALDGDPRLGRLGIVNFDAHLDLRRPEVPDRGTSGTPFLQIAEARAAAGLPFRYLCVGVNPAANTDALLDRAASLGVGLVMDVDCGQPSACDRLVEFVAGCSAVYLTVCLDVLPASVAPGVSAPAALGVPLDRVIQLVRRVVADCRDGDRPGRLVAADVAELCPPNDEGGRTARTAARIVYEIAAISR